MAGLAPSLLAPSLLAPLLTQAPSQVPHQPLYGPPQPQLPRKALRGPQGYRKAQQGPWQPPQPLAGEGLQWRRRGLGQGGLESPSPPYSPAGSPAAPARPRQHFKKRPKKRKEGKSPSALSGFPGLARLGSILSNLWPNPDKVEAADRHTNR